MAQNLTAEIISIGTEILLGELTDTNSVFIARTLRDLGINVYFMTSVGDNEARIVSALQIALSRADLVITCGGLGPTVDDMTRQAVATATDRILVFHQNLLDQIAERFKSFKSSMTENNRRQAFLPQDAILIDNPVGTAPSFIVELDNKAIISLPGVPREMKFLMQEKVISYLHGKHQLGIIKARIFKAAGIGESTLDDMLGDDLLQSANPSIGLAAHSGQIDIRVTAKAESEVNADQLIDVMELTIRKRVGQYIYGTDNDRLEDVLLNLLISHDLHLSIVEVGTGAHLVKSLQSASNYQDGVIDSIVSDDAEGLRTQFAIPPSQSWRDMAESIGKSLIKDTPISLCIVILSDPNIDEAIDSQETTVITIQTADKERTRVYGFGGKSELARGWISTWSLATAWKMLQEVVLGAGGK